MNVTTSGRPTATAGPPTSPVTLTQAERDYLLNGFLVAGLYAAADPISLGRGIDAETVESIRLAVRVSDALGIDQESGDVTIDDLSVLNALRSATARELDGLLADDEHDSLTPETRPIAIAVERKLGVDRFAIARRNGVVLQPDGTPEDRMSSLTAQREIVFWTRRAFDEAVAKHESDLDARSHALIEAIADALRAGNQRPIPVTA